MAASHSSDSPSGIQYLTDSEISSFLDSLDHNSDGYISYAEVEQNLDAAHDELLAGGRHLRPHHVISKSHTSASDRLRHDFLRSIMGLPPSSSSPHSSSPSDTSSGAPSGADDIRIPRADFASIVRRWQIPSPTQPDAATDSLSRLRPWRRVRAYWAVHGPELIFLLLVSLLVLALGLWQSLKYTLTPRYRAAFGWGVVLAKTCAGMLYPTFALLLLSMSRYLSTLLRRSRRLSRLVNVDLSQAFHIRISIAALALATLHAIGHLTGSFNHGSRPEHESAVAEVLGPDAVPRPYIAYVRSLPGFTGLTALGLFYLLALLSIPQVRRRNYELFQLSHLLMYPIIGLLMAHGAAQLLQWTMLGYFLAIPTLLVFTERLVRFGTGLHRIPARLRVLDSETVEVAATIPSERIWRYRAGQYVFLQVPRISLFQWHPFTVSICRGREFRLHIKTDGNWTKKLRELGGGEGEETEIEVGINGPFGAPAQRFYDFQHAVIVGSGIGVTPFSGILADLQARDDEEHGGPTHAAHQHHHQGQQTRHDSETTIAAEKQPHHESNEKHEASSSAPADPSTPNANTINEPSEPPHAVDVDAHDGPLFAPDYRRVDFHWAVRDRNHLLWIADLLNSVSRSQAWHREVEGPSQHLDIRIATHVTQKRRSLVTHVYRWLLEQHRTDAHPESPLTGLLNPTRFGRPDFDTILEEHYEDMRKFRASKRKVKSGILGGVDRGSGGEQQQGESKAATDGAANAKPVNGMGGGPNAQKVENSITDGTRDGQNGNSTGLNDGGRCDGSMSSSSGNTRAPVQGRGISRAVDDQYQEDEGEDEELKVGVFYCGAPVVGEILADKCRQLTVRGRHDGSKIEYHFMIEVFG